MSESRFLTTCNAACFSATNKTRLPLSTAFAIIFEIVWLLPVPGGPCRTNVVPLADSATAAYCVLSQARGVRTSAGSASSSLTAPPSMGASLLEFVKRLSISRFLRYSFTLFLTSAHMAYLAKVNCETYTSSYTIHPLTFAVLARNTAIISLGESPLPSTPRMSMPNSCFKNSRRVVLTSYSSPGSSTTPCVFNFFKVTGMSASGA